jgi:hypothetical protein
MKRGEGDVFHAELMLASDRRAARRKEHFSGLDSVGSRIVRFTDSEKKK